MANRLRRLKVHEVSLVDSPANQHARVLLAKRDAAVVEDEEDAKSLLEKVADVLGFRKNGGDPADELEDEDEGDEEDVSKVLLFDSAMALDQMYRYTSALSDSIRAIVSDDDATPEEKKSAAELSLMQFTDTIFGIIDAAIPADGKGAKPTEKSMDKSETHGKEREDVLKGLSPEARALIEKDLAAGKAAQEALEKRESDDKERVSIEKATTLVGKANIPVADVAHVLKQLDEAGQKTVADLLAKHNAALELGFKEVGSTVEKKTEDDGDDNEDKIEKAAEELRKKDPKLTREAAIAKVVEENPDLYEG